MEKTHSLFGENVKTKEEAAYGSLGEEKYTVKVDTPIYTPRDKCPSLEELFNRDKTNQLIREIEQSGLNELEKNFLINAAYRHTVFNYEKCADYYAFASQEMKDLMEKSALVIIDYDKAIEYGFVKLQNIVKKEVEDIKSKK